MGAQLKPSQPIVLFVGHDRVAEERVGNRNAYTKDIFGVKPLMLRLPQTAIGDWWRDPYCDTSIHKVIELRPSFSKNKILRWTETDAFVRYVRRVLTRWMTYDITGRSDGPNLFNHREWCEAVKMVVINQRYYPTSSSYTQRVFGHYLGMEWLFPNARNYMFDFHGRGELDPIWSTCDDEEASKRLVLVEPAGVAEAS